MKKVKTQILFVALICSTTSLTSIGAQLGNEHEESARTLRSISTITVDSALLYDSRDSDESTSFESSIRTRILNTEPSDRIHEHDRGRVRRDATISHSYESFVHKLKFELDAQITRCLGIIGGLAAVPSQAQELASSITEIICDFLPRGGIVGSIISRGIDSSFSYFEEKRAARVAHVFSTIRDRETFTERVSNHIGELYRDSIVTLTQEGADRLAQRARKRIIAYIEDGRRGLFRRGNVEEPGTLTEELLCNHFVDALTIYKYKGRSLLSHKDAPIETINTRIYPLTDTEILQGHY